MATIQELRRKLRRKGRARRWDWGKLGNGAGVVSVPGTTQECYVRMRGVVLIAYNDRTAFVDGLPVVVGYDTYQPDVLQVLTVKVRGGVQMPQGFSEQPHHTRHEFLNDQGGDDVVWINERMLLPLRVTPSSALNVEVYPGVLQTATGWLDIALTSLDLSSYQPGSGALWALICIDAVGSLSVTTGVSVSSVDLLRTSHIPAEPAGSWALAAVRLYDGQTAITETAQYNDVIDLRFVLRPGGSPQSWNALGVLQSEVDLALTKHVVFGG